MKRSTNTTSCFETRSTDMERGVYREEWPKKFRNMKIENYFQWWESVCYDAENSLKKFLQRKKHKNPMMLVTMLFLSTYFQKGYHAHSM